MYPEEHIFGNLKATLGSDALSPKAWVQHLSGEDRIFEENAPCTDRLLGECSDLLWESSPWVWLVLSR